MAYLNSIVTAINNTLIPLFGDRNVIAHGICEQMVRISEEGAIELLPSFVDQYGDGKYVGVDDSFDAILYHRVNSIQVGKTAEKAFGNDNNFCRHSAALSMVVFGQRNRLGVTGDELAIALDASFPEEIKKIVAGMQFKRCNAQTTNIVLNGLQVFSEEYRNIDYFLKPDQFLFKINYNIESTFLKGCFKTCLT